MRKPYAEVIGDPIVQSKSPAIHTYWLGKLGLDGDYKAHHVLSEGLADYLAGACADANWLGCNVTMPHKQAIIPLLDRLHPVAARIGAVNTVVREDDGSLTGRNTDAPGFLEPLLPVLADEGAPQDALVIGAGGAARAIVVALADAGLTITLAARDPAKARSLLDELAPAKGNSTMAIADLARPGYGAFGLVVNASPLGMKGNPPLDFHFGQASEAAIIYDIVTSPLVTPLIEQARARGLRTVDGLTMLIGQAAEAFEHFYGVAAPRGDGDAELRALLLGGA